MIKKKQEKEKKYPKIKNRIKSMLYEYVEEILSLDDIRELLMIVANRADMEKQEKKQYNNIRWKVESIWRKKQERDKNSNIYLTNHARIRLIERFWMSDWEIESLVRDLRTNTHRIALPKNWKFKIETKIYVFIISRELEILTVYENKKFINKYGKWTY